jgi:hypothetical protein
VRQVDDDDDDDDDQQIFATMMSTRVKSNIDPDTLWHSMKILDYNYPNSHIVEDNLNEETNNNNNNDDDDDDDDNPSSCSDMEENDVILETPPFSDDDNVEDLYPTPARLPVLVHTPNVSDEEFE